MSKIIQSRIRVIHLAAVILRIELAGSREDLKSVIVDVAVEGVDRCQ